MDREAAADNANSAQDDGNSAFAPTDSPPGVSIPDHRLLRCIGKGSYGSVWLAQNMMGMYRAVKIVRRQSFEHHRPFERELSGILKFEPISRSHEGFVDVLHVGIRDKDYLYYVMELGDDEETGQNIIPAKYSSKTLGRKISAYGRLSFDQCLKLGLAVSAALGELHKHGLVHRDIKPSNIIYVNGTAKLADIGLVASLEEARSYVGTEGFIPPEGPGTPAGDVYSLGKVLYEASTGKDRHEFPELPTLLYDLPERDQFLELNEIVLRACHADPKRRYQSAAEMHSDLVVLSNGQSVKRLRFLERRFAWLKRAAGLASVGFIAGTVILYLVYHAYIEARRRQIEAYVALGTRNVQSGDFLGSLPYFAEAARLDTDTASKTDDRMRYASTLAQCPKLIQMWSSQHQMHSAVFDSTGERVLILEYLGSVQLFDLKSGKPVSARISEALESADLSPDGKWIVTASLGQGDSVTMTQSPEIAIWTLDGTKVRTLDHIIAESVSFSPDGKRIVAGCNDSTARVWDVQTGTRLLTLTGHSSHDVSVDGVLAAKFSHDGKVIATGGRDSTARLWNAETGQPIGSPLQHLSWVNAVGFSPDDRKLVTGSFDHKAHVWDLDFNRDILPPLLHDDGVSTVQFSPDGRFIVTATLDRMVRIWIASDHRLAEVNPILKHSDRVMGASISPNGHQVATACFDGTVRVWELSGGQPDSIPSYYNVSQNGARYINTSAPEPAVFDTLTGRPVSGKLDFGFTPHDFRLTSDGNCVIAASLPRGTNPVLRELRALETVTGRPIGPRFSVPYVRGYVPSLDGRRVLASSLKNVQVWNTETGQPISPLLPLSYETKANVSVLFSPDNSRFLTWHGNHVQLFEVASGKEVFPKLTLETDVKNAEFNFDGSRFVTCCSDNSLDRCTGRIWNSSNGRQIGATLQHSDGVLCATFSPDGRRVATCSEDYTAIVWDAQTGRQLIPALRHVNQVLGVAFSPDSRWVATVSRDKTARVWSAETGDPLTPPLLHPESLRFVRFLPDGRHLLVRSTRNGVWLWKIPVDERPVEDLKKLADVLSNGAVVFSLDSPTNQAANLSEHWVELHKAYPDQFSVSLEQVASWDDYQSRQSEANRDWFGAQVHLERLLAAKPDDPSILSRLANIRQRAAATTASEKASR